MQKTQASNERSASLAAGRAGRQARRRSGVWLVPPPVQDDAALIADQLPQIIGALALDEAAEYTTEATSNRTLACALIVEDDPYVADLLCRALDLEAHTDWAIDITADGRATLLRTQEETPRIVLIDMRQPDIDGAEVYRRLRAHPATRDCQVVFLTASTALDLSMRGVEGGILLRKPVDIEQVIALITALAAE